MVEILRILHILYIYPPKSNVADGITNSAYAITQKLSQKGNEVTVYTSDMLDLHCGGSIKPGVKIVNGVRVHYLKSFWRLGTIIITPSIMYFLYKNGSTFDVIHIHDSRSFQGIIAYFFARIKKIPYVYQPHGSYLFSLNDSSLKHLAKFFLDKLISNSIIRGSSKIIALNTDEVEQCASAGIPKEKLVIIPNGIDLTKYHDLPLNGSFKSKFHLQGYKVVLFLGRIHRIKGVDILVRAFASVVSKIGNVKLVIAGPDDGYLRETEALVSCLKLCDSVLFTGALYGRDKIEAFVDSDVFVLPSRYETFPMSLLESYACSKPVVATMVGGISDLVIPGKTGLLVAPTDINGFANSIVSLLNNDRQAIEMGLNGRKFVSENFGLDKVVKKLESVYRDV